MDADQWLNFNGCSFPANEDCLKKCHFQTAVLRFVKGSVDVDREKSKKKTSAQVLTANFKNDTLASYLEFARSYMKFVSDGLNAQILLKYNLVKKIAKFEFSVILGRQEAQAVSRCSCLFNSFSVRGWVAKEIETVHIEQQLHLVGDLRYGYFD